MSPAVRWLLIWALLVPGAWAGGGKQEGTAPKPKTLAPLTLTSEHPAGSFALDPKTIASAPPVLAIALTKVVNPGQVPFQVFVYLSYRSKAERSEPEKILVGNFSLYPADRPAGFVLRSSTGFSKLKATGAESTGVQLVLEMERIHKGKPWSTPVEVTVAPPEWREEPKHN
jgi:hypothetical protein